MNDPQSLRRRADRILPVPDSGGGAQPATAQYPHKEPECLKIANDALSQVGTTIEMFRPDLNSSRAHGFDRWDLNLWALDTWFGNCATAPAVRNRSTGAPWSVYVVPYGAGCQAPADLVLQRAIFGLRLSGDTGNLDFPNTGDFGKVRIAARFFCQVELGVRLKPGWEGLSCLVEIQPDGQCGLPTTRPERTVILTSDGCSRVPLKIVWRGLCGPRPWSRDHFQYIDEAGGVCCNLLRGDALGLSRLLVHGSLIRMV